jgi:hypothetical protein
VLSAENLNHRFLKAHLPYRVRAGDDQEIRIFASLDGGSHFVHFLPARHAIRCAPLSTSDEYVRPEYAIVAIACQTGYTSLTLPLSRRERKLIRQ